MEALNALYDYRSNLITWLRRNEEGVIVQRQQVGEFVSFHKSPITDAYRKFVRYQNKEGGYWRVIWKSREDRERCCKALGDSAFEADVMPIRRVLSDAKEIIIQRPRMAWYDIETDDRVPFQQAVMGGARILCLTVELESESDANQGRVFSFLLKEDTDEAEKEMLEQFIEILEIFVDQLIGWNSSKFDDPIIQERSRLLGLETKVFRRILFMDHMLCYKKHNLNSAESGEQKQSMALNAIAFAELGEGKRDLGGVGIYELWQTNPQKLLEYNIQDVALMPKIEKKTGYLDLQYSVCQLTRQFPNTSSLFASRYIDSFMLMLGAELNHHFPSKWYDEDKEYEGFKGAYVLHPTELGIHRNVHTYDFSSLYPSVFRTFNLSTETKIGPSDNPKPEWILSPGTNIYFDGSKKGIWVIFFERAAELRKKWQHLEEESEPDSIEQKYAQRMSMGSKVVINSGYGVATSPISRYYDKEVGESCTQNGAWLTKSVMEELRNRNLLVLTGDSVTPDRTVVVKRPNGIISILSFEELWSLSENKIIRNKETASLPGWKALSKNSDGKVEWNPIERIIRHKTSKTIWNISNKKGNIEVTEDHSIVIDNEEITPARFIKENLQFECLDAIGTERKSEYVDLFLYIQDLKLPSMKRRGKVNQNDSNITVDRFFYVTSEYEDRIYLNGDNRNYIKRFYKKNSNEMKSLMRIIGAYLSEGSASLKGLTTSRYLVSFCQQEISWLDELKNDLSVLGSFYWNEPLFSPGSNASYIRNGTSILSCFFASLCGFKSSGKFVPDFVYELEAEDFKELWNKIVEGDGHIQKYKTMESISYDSKSQKLIAGLSYCLSLHKIEHYLYYRDDKKVWRLRTRPSGVQKSKVLNKVKRFKYDGFVYDLSIANGHTFVDGIGRVLLHNTDAQQFKGCSVEEARNIVNYLNNEYLPAIIKACGCIESFIKLEYEKSFDWVVYSTDGKGEAVAKKYVGVYSIFRGKTVEDGEPKIRGLEFKRSDALKLAREMQFDIFKMLKQKVFTSFPYEKLILEYRNKIMNGPLLAEDIVQSKSISRPLNEYKSNSAHIRLAKELEEEGEEVDTGTRVHYYIQNGSTSPKTVKLISEYNNDADRYYIWNRVYEPSLRILGGAFPRTPWNHWRAKKPKQPLPGQLGLFQ